MGKVFLEYIEYLKEKARLKYYRCEHDWELLMVSNYESTINPNYKWLKWTYRCKKCGEAKIISNE